MEKASPFPPYVPRTVDFAVFSSGPGNRLRYMISRQGKRGQIYFLRAGSPLGIPAKLSLVPPTGFALHGESLSLVWPRESNQREGHPDIRVWPPARLPSLRRCSGGRLTRAILGPLSLSPHPCGSSPYATPPLGLLTGNRIRVARAREKGTDLFSSLPTRSFPPDITRTAAISAVPKERPVIQAGRDSKWKGAGGAHHKFREQEPISQGRQTDRLRPGSTTQGRFS